MSTTVSQIYNLDDAEKILYNPSDPVNPVEFSKLIPYREIYKSIDYSFQGSEHRLKRVFLTTWDDRQRFLIALFGFPIYVPSTSGYLPYISRRLPQPYLTLTNRFGKEFLYPKAVERIEPVAPTGLDPAFSPAPRSENYSNYHFAKITVSYDTPTFAYREDEEVSTQEVGFTNQLNVTPRYLNNQPGAIGTKTFRGWPIPSTPNSTLLFQEIPYDLGGFRFITKIVQPRAEYIRLPVGGYYWSQQIADGNGVVLAERDVPITGTYGTQRASAEVTYIWHCVPALPQKAYYTYDDNDSPILVESGARVNLIGAAYTHIGSVNRFEFDGYYAGTLLLTSVEAKPYRWIDGQLVYDYIYKMKYMDIDYVPEDDYTTVLPGYIQGTRIGHNFFLRHYAKPSSSSSGLRVPPQWVQMTHNGDQAEFPYSLNSTGKPIFQPRDFQDLFIPFTREEITGIIYQRGF